MSKYREIDLTKIRTISIKDRLSKVDVENFAGVFKRGMSFHSFLNSLPKILKGSDLRELVGRIVEGHRQDKPLIWMMGSHVIKCGLAPVVVDLMERGVISAVAFNGSGVIHDIESAYWGKTSEDVATNLDDGTFGMSAETAELVNDTINLNREPNLGMGEILGKRVAEENPEYARFSILASGYKNSIPVTVHVGIGTDIVHQHPNADGAAIGIRSLRDFRILAETITKLGDGGVVVNIGSAVILPEVFLKALTVARNTGFDVGNFYTADFDMIQHYRPGLNVVERPVSKGGKGFRFTGHHEIMIPLLAAGIIESLAE